MNSLRSRPRIWVFPHTLSNAYPKRSSCISLRGFLAMLEFHIVFLGDMIVNLARGTSQDVAIHSRLPPAFGSLVGPRTRRVVGAHPLFLDGSQGLNGDPGLRCDLCHGLGFWIQPMKLLGPRALFILERFQLGSRDVSLASSLGSVVTSRLLERAQLRCLVFFRQARCVSFGKR